MNKDNAVSDAIGVILMIAIAVAAIGILTAFLLGTIQIQQIPQTDLTITKSATDTVKIIHQRGDPLDYNDTVIRFNQGPEDFKNTFWIKKYGQSKVLWKNNKDTNGKVIPFEIGDVMESTTTNVQNISISYNLSSGQILLESIDF